MLWLFTCCCTGTPSALGERAARVLSAVFVVAEMCIETLAIDTARAEAAKDDADDRGIDTMPVLSERQGAPLSDLGLLNVCRFLRRVAVALAMKVPSSLGVPSRCLCED